MMSLTLSLGVASIMHVFELSTSTAIWFPSNSPAWLHTPLVPFLLTPLLLSFFSPLPNPSRLRQPCFLLTHLPLLHPVLLSFSRSLLFLTHFIVPPLFLPVSWPSLSRVLLALSFSFLSSSFSSCTAWCCCCCWLLCSCRLLP